MKGNRPAAGVLVFMCAWGLIACSTGSFTGQTAPEDATVYVTAERDGTQINLGQGDMLVVTLDSNPSTGYSWQIQDNDQAILRQQGESQFQASSNLVGAGGTETFRFEAVGKGTSVLRMVYLRSFEDEEPIDSFSLRVVVE